MSPAEIRALVKLELKNHKEWKIENLSLIHISRNAFKDVKERDNISLL